MSALALTFVSSFTCPRRKLEKCSQMSTNVLMDPALGFAQETFCVSAILRVPFETVIQSIPLVGRSEPHLAAHPKRC